MRLKALQEQLNRNLAWYVAASLGLGLLLGFLLSRLFLPDPLLAFGFMLVMVVPCSSMSIGYTGLVKGNLELATVVVAASFLAAIPAIPFWASIFGGQYQVAYLRLAARVRRWFQHRDSRGLISADSGA